MSSAATPATRRVLILGDSLGAPRPHRGQKLACTWPVRLKESFPQLDIWQRCRAGSMSNEVLKEFHQFSDSLEAFDLLVIQVGIGDCCPRPYPLFVEKFLQTYELRRLHKWLSARYRFLLRFRARQWISRRQYVANLREMIDLTQQRNPRARICVIKIGTPHGDFVQKVPDAPTWASAYNAALEESCRLTGTDGKLVLLDPYDGLKPEDLFIQDGHHLSVRGHEAVYETLFPHFLSLLTREPPDAVTSLRVPNIQPATVVRTAAETALPALPVQIP